MVSTDRWIAFHRRALIAHKKLGLPEKTSTRRVVISREARPAPLRDAATPRSSARWRTTTTTTTTTKPYSWCALAAARAPRLVSRLARRASSLAPSLVVV
eukprot:30776-Pelagococcus_subviridis.AAC.3